MSLRTDSSHQPCLPAPFLEAPLHCQTAEHSVSASPESTTIHGLCQRSSLYVDKQMVSLSHVKRKVYFFSTLFPLTFLVADTKFEQISEDCCHNGVFHLFFSFNL